MELGREQALTKDLELEVNPPDPFLFKKSKRPPNNQEVSCRPILNRRIPQKAEMALTLLILAN
jgi:hypothetical protein